MMGFLSRLKRIGRVAAWTAAYALVLQVVLASALMAGMPRGPGADLSPLCLNGGAGDHGGTDGGRDPSAIHCALCLARADTLGLPPPALTPECDRIAVELRHRIVVRDGLCAAAHRVPQQPRAPPAFS